MHVIAVLGVTLLTLVVTDADQQIGNFTVVRASSDNSFDQTIKNETFCSGDRYTIASTGGKLKCFSKTELTLVYTDRK